MTWWVVVALATLFFLTLSEQIYLLGKWADRQSETNSQMMSKLSDVEKELREMQMKLDDIERSIEKAERRI